MKTETVKGFKDSIGKEAENKAAIRKMITYIFERYGFNPVETPIIEYEEFVKGDNAQDEAVSDIFKLKDKGKRKLALRYEFTFQLKRLMKNQKLPFKRYQIGEIFRDEPVTGNRFRQFTQCDADVIGSDVRAEAELLAMTKDVLANLGVKAVILINNRKLLNEILDDAGIKEKYKQDVLREIDRYGKLPESEIKKNLKKYKADKIIASIKKGEKFFKKFESYKEILSLMAYCKVYGVKVMFAPTIIRGLSYYNGSVFEVKAEKIRETIIAGGSYMFNGVQSTGISFGLDRLCSLGNIKSKEEKYLVVSLKEDKKTIELAQKLRRDGKIVSIQYGKPSKALDYANSYGFNKVIFVGNKEVKKKLFKVKDMKTGKEKKLDLKK